MARPDVGADFRPKLPRSGLSGAQVALATAIAQALHLKRLQWAEADNVPMGRMLSNMAVTDLALKPPGNVKELSRAAGVRGAFVRAHGDEVLALVRDILEKARAGQLPAEAESKGPRDPNKRKREEALKAFRVAKSAERKVTPSAVLPNPVLDVLATEAPTSLEALARVPYLGDKRVRLYGAELVALLATFPPPPPASAAPPAQGSLFAPEG
jgi:ribonuclease D